ncbi:MAG: phage tail protein [Chloroflexi bacterium]|nr:phage tail protein [Chloroflexota bacterium]
MTDVPPASAAEPFEPDTSGLAETLAVTGQSEWDPVVARQGEVTGVAPGVGVASVCSVEVGGAAPISNVRHLCDTPEVGDTVWLLQIGPMRLIIGIVGGDEKVGAIKWIGGTTGAPAGWWPCDGRSTTGYPKLAVRYGANIPDLSDRFVVSSGPSTAIGATGGAASHSAPPAHGHPNIQHDHLGAAHTHPNIQHDHTTPAHGHNTTQHDHVSTSGVDVVTSGSGTAANIALGGTAFVVGERLTGQGGANIVQSGGGGITGQGGANIVQGGGEGLTGQGGANIVSNSTGPASVDNRPPFFALLAIIKFG